jgi:anthranilate phosphoribosyltransferase
MSGEYAALLNRLLDGESLTEEEAASVMHAMAAGALPPAVAGALLAGMRAKGETAQEIRGFATAMRELAVRPAIPAGAPIVDTVGTGGDGSGSLNLSTGAGLLAAACGARVVKHGNRSISSRSGSADLLECLGMPVPLEAQAAVDCLQATDFTFLFAPAWHPAMKAIMPVRTALGVRTVFNLLGPLTNPAAPPYQLIGAFSVAAAKLMADTLAGMPIERAFVVHGEPGWDEATPVGEFVLFDVRPGMVTPTRRTPEQYGMTRCAATDLAGGDASHNARELVRVFAGEDRGAHRDALLMGTSLVLEVLGRAEDAKEGVAMASAAIDSGAAQAFLGKLTGHFAEQNDE